MIQGQDHVYVVFTLPALNSPAHRSRTIQPGPWGPDVQANGLMGLLGHSYVQIGAAQCLLHHDERIVMRECFFGQYTLGQHCYETQRGSSLHGVSEVCGTMKSGTAV